MQHQQTHTPVLQEKALVSFIITAYNLPSGLLQECLDSILALSLSKQEREIILVDDGSETSPLAELTPYLDDISYVRQKNEGLSAARNTGLKMASGTFIQFIDGDDRLISTVYDHCLDIARYLPTEMIIFDFTNKSKVSTVSFADEGPFSGIELMKRQNIRGMACGYLFRRTILGDLRFTPDIYHEDEEFTPNLLLRAETVHCTDAKAYFYRKRDHSITTDKENTEKRMTDMKDIILRLNLQADRLPSDERQALQRRVAQLTMDYIYKIIVETRDRSYLDAQLKELEKRGLYPLPERNYTTKYKWFRRMANSEKGLKMLFFTLPYMKKER